jgi:hypothetical protein
MNQELIDNVKSSLHKLGWTAVPGVALGGKKYATAVGPKEALAYLQDFGRGENSVVLTGTYQSEGRNCLASTMVHIPKSADADVIARLTERFVTEAETAIADTYAYRLQTRV